MARATCQLQQFQALPQMHLTGFANALSRHASIVTVAKVVMFRAVCMVMRHWLPGVQSMIAPSYWPGVG